MRTPIIASAALATALFAGGALADQHGAASGAADAINPTEPPASGQQAEQPTEASDLIGRTVVGQDGEEVGEINAVLRNEDGRPTHVVISHGGMLGMGDKEVAVGFDQLKMEQDNIQVSMSNDELAALPAHEGTAGEATRPPEEAAAPDVSPSEEVVPPSEAGAGGSRLDAMPGVADEPIKPQPAD